MEDAAAAPHHPAASMFFSNGDNNAAHGHQETDPSGSKQGRPIRWGTIIPLIGGSALGCREAAGSLPLFHLSYQPFQANEVHIRHDRPSFSGFSGITFGMLYSTVLFGFVEVKPFFSSKLLHV
jgi:hypothetical protein